jgi:hypothetical protein
MNGIFNKPGHKDWITTTEENQTMKQGDIVDYKGSRGEVTAVLDDTVSVRLSDGKEYLLPMDSLKIDGVPATGTPVSIRNIIDAMKPHVKKMEFLQDMAKAMHEVGVSELQIRDGNIASYVSRETYEEKLARMEAEAKVEVAKRAREEYDRENIART